MIQMNQCLLTTKIHFNFETTRELGSKTLSLYRKCNLGEKNE